MKTVNKSVLIWYSPEEMYALVTDVDHYADFLPWCDHARILEQDAKRLIPPEGSSYLHLNYNSRKNVGEVMHSVYIYGNIEPNGIKELSFIVNVVPDPDYTRDYEQLYRATQQGGVGDIVDGETRDKGYFIKGYYPEEFINTPRTEVRDEMTPFK